MCVNVCVFVYLLVCVDFKRFANNDVCVCILFFTDEHHNIVHLTKRRAKQS